MRISVSVFLVFLLCVFVFQANVQAQTTTVTYQGRLHSANMPANGSFDFEFALYDAASGGAQIGPMLARSGIMVTDGGFATNLDFGSSFPGANRFLEIRVREAGGGAFTVLEPRQLVTSSPYSIKSLTADGAAVAVNADTATNALSLGGVAAGQYVLTTDERMTDERDPKPGSVNYIQNTITQQPASNFSVSGTGTADILNAASHFRIGNMRVLGIAGQGNLFAGIGSGIANTDGTFNSFFGDSAGFSNSTGFNNSFFGSGAGRNNTTASNNSFFGEEAGFDNTTGGSNSFFGSGAGSFNTTGSSNSFFGQNAGYSNTTGDSNAFVGRDAGFFNTAGGSNSFFGNGAGVSNTTGNSNTFAGRAAGFSNTTGSSNVFVGQDAGFANTTGGSNSFFGRATGRSNTTGGSNSFFGRDAGLSNTTAGRNSFFGDSAGESNTIGIDNSFFGANAGLFNTEGGSNAFFGVSAGQNNTTGVLNSFFGLRAGFANSTGDANSFFGIDAGRNNITGVNNSFFGGLAGSGNTAGHNNSFFGVLTGEFNSTGNQNSFFGESAGSGNTSGGGNTFVGRTAGSFNTTGISNTAIGNDANMVAGDLNFATAIGAGSRVPTSNTIVLGRSSGSDAVVIHGTLNVGILGNGGVIEVCRGIVPPQLATCSSSLRYKSQVRTFTRGLDVVSRLRPIRFDWNDGGVEDLGFGAEDVAEVEPLLATYNDKAEVEGVKYRQITTVLVNAVNEQQAQIQRQQSKLEAQEKLIDDLKALVCKKRSREKVCRK
ncbi:MAG: tail fiber domain-containing protein [Pyrinomonadaceae bacterium]